MSFKAFMFLAVMLLMTACGSGRNASAGTSEKAPVTSSEAVVAESAAEEAPAETAAAEQTSVTPAETKETTLTESEEDTMDNKTITVTVNGSFFTARLADTAAAEQFAEMLPLTLDMSELNGNEKYIYTDTAFPAQAESVGQIEKGDIMLYGDNCVVLFYESFSTPYSYTRLGSIEKADGLESAVGSGDVSVSFESDR